jgi:hypothetical protein
LSRLVEVVGSTVTLELVIKELVDKVSGGLEVVAARSCGLVQLWRVFGAGRIWSTLLWQLDRTRGM